MRIDPGRAAIFVACITAVGLMVTVVVKGMIASHHERARLERLAAERDARAEQNRLNFLEYERQQRAIPVYRPTAKPQPGQRDA